MDILPWFLLEWKIATTAAQREIIQTAIVAISAVYPDLIEAPMGGPMRYNEPDPIIEEIYPKDPSRVNPEEDDDSMETESEDQLKPRQHRA